MYMTNKQSDIPTGDIYIYMTNKQSDRKMSTGTNNQWII